MAPIGHFIYLGVIMKIKNIILFGVFFLSMQPIFSVTRLINVKVIEINNSIEPQKLYREIYLAGKNSEVDALLLLINHHGGGLGILSTVADMVEVTNTKKPVVSLIMGEATSMGYYIASGAGFIIAHSMSEVGALGVIHTHFKDTKLTREKQKDISAKKVTPLVIAIGKHKGTYYPYSEPASEEQLAHIRTVMENHYNTMIGKVAKKRNLNLSESNEWADGKLFTANQALKLGLIDKIGTITDATKAFQICFEKRFPEENWEQYGVNYIQS